MMKKAPLIISPKTPQTCKLFVDLMYITPNSTQLDFLIVVNDFGLVMVRPIPTKTAHQLGLGLKEMMGILERYDWRVSAVRADNEGPL